MIKDDLGNVSILICGLCFVIMLFAIGTFELGRAQIIKSKMQNAADAAALSAAFDVSKYETEKACSSAVRTAQKNSAKIVSCDVSSNIVYVEVSDKTGKVVAQAKAEVD